MFEVIQHLPGFIDGEPEVATVETVDQLIALFWVKRWENNPQFSHWEKIETIHQHNGILVARMKEDLDGKHRFWCVAHVPTELMVQSTLPDWRE